MDKGTAKWRKTKEYRNWRRDALLIQKVCSICGDTGNLQVHHKADGSTHPELRYCQDNAVVVCWDCHRHLHCTYKKSYRQKTTEDDWNNFNELAYHYMHIGMAKERMNNIKKMIQIDTESRV
jgi:5-methylcytosine-specific restriction endonuclease McrA